MSIYGIFSTVSALCLQAPQKQMGSLPSLMLKDPEEEQVCIWISLKFIIES